MILEVRKRAIARDFHFTDLTSINIGEKYKVGHATAYKIAKEYPRESVYKPEKYQLLKFPEDQHRKAILILREHGIDYEETTEKFELLEYYESSIK